MLSGWTGEFLKVWFWQLQTGLIALGWAGLWGMPALASPDQPSRPGPIPLEESHPPRTNPDVVLEPVAANGAGLTDWADAALPTTRPAIFPPRPAAFPNPPSSEISSDDITTPVVTQAAALHPLPPAGPELPMDRGRSGAVVPTVALGGAERGGAAAIAPSLASGPDSFGSGSFSPEVFRRDRGDVSRDGTQMEADDADDADDADLNSLPQDPELGIIRVRNPLEDPELGILRIREQPDVAALPAVAAPKVSFLTVRFSGVSSDNILLVVNDVGGLTGGQFYRPSATLGFYPSLGPTTSLVGTLDVGLQRYPTQSAINYDDWRVRLGLRQTLTPRSHAQLNLSYQELLRPGTRQLIFENRSIGLTLGRRDPITPRLILDSTYQVQYNDARSRSVASSGPLVTDFSRITHGLNIYLGYTPSHRWHTGLNYQLTLFDYTVQDRHDTVQQIIGQVAYSITPLVRLSVYGGWSFGRSSDPRIRYGDTILGVSIDATLPLF